MGGPAHRRRGELPAGWLWELEKSSLVAGPQVWQELLEEAGTPLVGLHTHGFGSAAESQRVDVRHDPILLTLVDGRTAELVGTTGPVFAEPEREAGGTEGSGFSAIFSSSRACQPSSTAMRRFLT